MIRVRIERFEEEPNDIYWWDVIACQLSSYRQNIEAIKSTKTIAKYFLLVDELEFVETEEATRLPQMNV